MTIPRDRTFDLHAAWRLILSAALIGAILGLPILGVGGRIIMRIIAHWEGRVPVLTFGGTLTIVFAGTMAGLIGGAAHGILRWFVKNALIRNTVFLLLCIAFTWHAVNALLPRPRLMFVALTVVYVVALEVVTSRRDHAIPIVLTDVGIQ
jgi:hypothetical protein